MRRIHISILLTLCACGLLFGAGAPSKAHPTYRIGSAPKPEFKVGAKSYKIDPNSKSVRTIRMLPQEHFNPITRHERVEKFYRDTIKERWDEWHRHPGHHCGPYRWEFIYWMHHHWPARLRARWAWHHRIYLEEPLWAEWMADPAFAAEVATLKRDNVVADLDYMPTEYASTAPVAIYGDEYLNAVYNPMPFLAILTLKSIKPDAKTDWIGTAATDSLLSKLASVPGLFVADREQMTGTLKDQKLLDGDASEPGRAAKIGKALNVERVVAGSYVVDGDKVLFNLRIVDTETGAVKNGISKTIPRDKLLDEMPQLAVSLATELGFDAQTDLMVATGGPSNGGSGLFGGGGSSAPGGGIFNDGGRGAAAVTPMPPVMTVPPPSGSARRVLTADDKITGDLSFTAEEGPYEIKEKLAPAEGVEKYTLRVGPGTEIRGGTILLLKGGHLEISGTPEKPAIFRHIYFQQNWQGGFKAKYAIFEDCKFRKGGNMYAYAGNSSKWEFDKCLITGESAFAKISHIDYGIKLTDCTFSGVTFENITVPKSTDKFLAASKEKSLDYMESLRQGWRTIDHCRFDACTVPPTIFWCAMASDYTRCTFVTGPAFESDTATDVVAYVANTTGDGPDAIAAATPAKRAALKITTVPQPFQVFTFPK